MIQKTRKQYHNSGMKYGASPVVVIIKILEWRQRREME
jgi:hypothetical protein